MPGRVAQAAALTEVVAPVLRQSRPAPAPGRVVNLGCRWPVEAGESGAEAFDVGMVELVENCHGLLPGFAGGVEVAGGVVGVAKVGERFGLEIAIP